MAFEIGGECWDDFDALSPGKSSDDNPHENFFTIDEQAMAAMDVYDMSSMDNIMDEWRTQAHKKMKRKKSVEAKPLVLAEMVETVGDTYWTSGASAPKKNVRGPILRTRSDPVFTGQKSVPGRFPTSSSAPSVSPKVTAFHCGRAETVAAFPTIPSIPELPPDLPVESADFTPMEKKPEPKDVWKPAPIKQAIDRILIGEPVVLEWYRSLLDKKALLAEAISTHDGNTIITVVLFIQKTLSKALFEAVLCQFPVAAQHYCSYLRQNTAWEQLKGIYHVLGAESYGLLQYEMCLNIEDIDTRLKSLDTCRIMFRSRPQLAKEAVFVEEYVHLLKRQQKIESLRTKYSGERNAHPVVDTTLVVTLTYCCRYHYSEPDTKLNSPESLRNDFGVSEKQYFVVFLISLCARKDWESIERFLTPKGWSSKLQRAKIKAPMSVERVIRVMGRECYHTPEYVLEKYVRMIEDPDVRMEYANKYKCYGVGIETLKNQKNMEKLKEYFTNLPVERQRQYRPTVAKLFM